MNISHKLGRQGEALAAAFLEQKKYRIIERNYRHGRADVDLIAIKDNFQSLWKSKPDTTFFGAPETFLKHHQQQCIVEAIDYYVKKNQLKLEIRFDIIRLLKTVGGFEIKHLKNAFYHF